MSSKLFALSDFYRKFANTPIDERSSIISEDSDNPLYRMNLLRVHESLDLLTSEIRQREERIKEILKEISKVL